MFFSSHPRILQALHDHRPMCSSIFVTLSVAKNGELIKHLNLKDQSANLDPNVEKKKQFNQLKANNRNLSC